MLNVHAYTGRMDMISCFIMTLRGYVLVIIIGALIQAVCVSCQCDNSPVVTRVPLYHTASITSPGYPGNYAINLNCSWIFEFEHETDYFFVRMDDVYVDCKGDLIRLINLHTNANIVSFCADATTSDVYTQSGDLRVEFSTNGVQRDYDKGFRLYVTSMPSVKMDLDVADCPVDGDVGLLAEKNTKVLTSPNFPQKYPSSQTCYWNIPSKTGHKIVITVDFIDIEYGSSPPAYPVDYLLIRYVDGNLTSQDQVYAGRWKFQPVPNNVITSLADVKMTFTSDTDTSYAGFLLRYKLVELASTHTENTESTSNGKVITTEEIPVTSEESVLTTEDTLSSTHDTLSTSEDTVSTSQDNIITTEDTVFTTEVLLSTSQESIVTTEEPSYTSEDTLSTSDDKLSTSGTVLSTSEDTISSSENSLFTSTNILSTSKEIVVTTEETLFTTESLLFAPKEDSLSTDNTISTSDDISSNGKGSFHTTTETIAISGITTKNDTIREEIVVPRYVYGSKVKRRTSSCDVQTCVIPLVVAIGLLLSILFVVIVALGVTRSRRKDRYNVRKAFPCRPPVAETANGDFDL